MFDSEQIKSVATEWLNENPIDEFEKFYIHFIALYDVTRATCNYKNYILNCYNYVCIFKLYDEY